MHNIVPCKKGIGVDAIVDSTIVDRLQKVLLYCTLFHSVFVQRTLPYRVRQDKIGHLLFSN